MSLRRTEIITKIALVVALVIVCLNAWLAFRSVRILEQSQYWVAHTWRLVNTTERIMGSMKDAETGNRGYLLTGDPAYLAPYNQAVVDLPEEFRQASTLAADDARGQAEIAQMQTLVDQRLNVLQSGIDQRRSGNTNAADLIVRSGTGKTEMDHLRATANSVQNQENLLLDQRVTLAAKAKSRSRITILLVSAIDVVLIAFGFWMLDRERRLRQNAHATADRLEKLQAISDVGLTRRAVADLIDTMLDRLINVIHADAVVFCNWRAEEIEVVASKGAVPSSGLRVHIDQDSPLYVAGFRKQIARISGDIAQSVPIEGIRGQMNSVLILSVIVTGQVTALLVAGRRDQDAFHDEDENLLTLAADRIGMAVDRANAYEAEREARTRAEKSASEVQALNAELEERVQARTAELETSNHELEAFSYSVSHDLRAPLRSIDGFSLALQEDFFEAMTAEGRDYIHRIRTGVQKMGQLIDSLLQLSRITRAEVVRERVNVSDLATDIARDLRAQNLDRNLTFVIEPGLETNADAKLFRIVLENLLGNAAKFTSRRAEAIIELGRSPVTEEFFVRDNGAGFDMQYAGKLFQAFQRLHGEKDFRGSGIGLATVSRVIQRHKGTIRTDSAVDRGATFWFTVG